ncbi:cuticle protein 63-like [Hylaeus volcanicus]|uniref:cuticle protein 63-like n=1 Tax=Hylaeus volcanicus TaxID=313075 RepID=UPI0023B7BF90|nr:cuticle protein 63-like [Hylaeus volcanicus]
MYCKLLVFLAGVAYASAGLYTGYENYGYGSYGLNHGLAAAAASPYTPVTYVHPAPVATSYSNSYKVALAPTTKYALAPPVSKVFYNVPSPISKIGYVPSTYVAYPQSYSSLTSYPGSLGYGYKYKDGLGLGYGYGYGSGYDLGYASAIAHGYPTGYDHLSKY